MNNILREIRLDDVVIYTEHSYSVNTLKKCEKIFNALVKKGEITGRFYEDFWMCYSGVKKFGISFQFDSEKYRERIGNEFGIAEEKMKNMLKCYAIYCNGVYIYSTIAHDKIAVICTFLESYKDKNYKIKCEDISTLEEFLVFTNTPVMLIEKITSSIRLKKRKIIKQRQLSPVINYLVIENEINSMYRNQLNDETFKRWFPIYFWVNITFILPLRATEMLVTPKHCITRIDDKVYINIRRTRLKKGKRTVYYDVEKDYKEFTYEIPDKIVADNIERYMGLTKNQNRRFLFKFSVLMLNEMFSLQAFNHLLSNFIDEKIIGNRNYDFAKYATGIEAFEYVTAGDSRPIAMANLYFQKFGEDICRQLADHINIDTSAGYYTNISETILASSIMQHHKKINLQSQDLEHQYTKSHNMVVATDKSVCVSKRREIDIEDLTDCINEGHLEECMGCKFFRPSIHELDEFLRGQKKKADDGAIRAIEFMNNVMSIKNRETTLEEVFLSIQTDATRYRMGCDIKIKEKWEEWESRKNIQKTSY
ncbi:MAG: hypothetical protein CVV02_04890 [Firmicutes bacterium HGW-Firmicutes-7]|nr:MAG: hypothetical protein CVV02_04890 [Firmicutes bacterium HGW-Firmicutes-7]